ncbi:MAG: reductive dehalogenase [Desulfobacterales bacterium]|nr:reductive dehalogenase [Desulfobacterales bacterium]
MEKSEDWRKLSRRQFLKASGAASAVMGSAGLGVFGYQAGKDSFSYTGCESFQGQAENFNRQRFAADHATYEKVGVASRVDARTEVIFSRVSSLMRQWDEEKGLDSLDKGLQAYYKKHPYDLKEDLHARKKIFPKRQKDEIKYKKKFVLAKAWSNAMSAVWPPGIRETPERYDFPRGEQYGEPVEPLKMKSPEKTSQLIKQISYQLGSTLVGITKLNPDWVYSYPMWGRGLNPELPLEIPGHWEYAIVIGTPMSWDPMYANPNYGTSFDAYAKSRIIAYRLIKFIRQLGYPARPHTPGVEYDLMVPPIAIDAGLGEQGRHGVMITPELGSNFRPAVVTTNIPMKTDKPIDFGVQDFCKTCRICAKNCPSRAIPMGDKEVVRGYRRYKINSSRCYNFWYSNLGNIGCRLCVTVCPYTRKSNWLHRTALEVTANDPSGMSQRILSKMQKSFYPAPHPQEYYIPSMGGKNESYREPPWWLQTEDFIDIDI